MLDIHAIRNNPDQLDQMLTRRGQDPVATHLLSLDRSFRDAKDALDRIRCTLNEVTKQVKNASNAQERSDLVSKATDIKKELSAMEQETERQQHQRDAILVTLPNMLAADVPDGQDESDNVEMKQWGTIPELDCAKDHVAIANGLSGMHAEQAGRVSGARFSYLSGVVARLERALGQWMIDVHSQKFGFVEMAVPHLVTKKTMYWTGQLPKFEGDIFCTKDGRYLIPTSEVPLVAFGAQRRLQKQDLPLCLTALTPCFRSEAGASGKDTHGLIRQHQFNKVELVVLCHEADAAEWHEKMVHQARFILESLELPYRQVLLCAGDTGHHAQKTYDLEVWMPSQNTYREIASCSMCGDYQSRRMECKVKDGDKWSFVHTLNGSGVAVGRALAAVLENGQQPDGRSVVLPKVLHDYMGCRSLELDVPLTP